MNPWILHVKKYAKDHNITYPEALKKAASSYKKKRGGCVNGAGSKSPKKKSSKKKMVKGMGMKRRKLIL